MAVLKTITEEIPEIFLEKGVFLLVLLELNLIDCYLISVMSLALFLIDVKLQISAFVSEMGMFICTLKNCEKTKNTES